MYDSSFITRLRKLGARNLILSYDTLAGVVAFSAVYIYTGGGISEATAAGILSSFATVSATLFAIVLTGLTIITSFTDRLFLYAWQDVGEFENIVTTFQYNLGLPVVVLLFTLALQVEYHRLAMLILIAVFVYMLFALLDLVGLISRYALQRGEFVKQQVEAEIEQEEIEQDIPDEELSKEELHRVREQLAELEKEKE
ncbi:hypothetical protein [Halostella salina]|uniref:hypothetical protein n=1 Tax=Halostella salina TaxID=1547897 RepID=UPI000EF83E88|nr:hypothetical protein [Halostella salina]